MHGSSNHKVHVGKAGHVEPRGTLNHPHFFLYETDLNLLLCSVQTDLKGMTFDHSFVTLTVVVQIIYAKMQF